MATFQVPIRRRSTVLSRLLVTVAGVALLSALPWRAEIEAAEPVPVGPAFEVAPEQDDGSGASFRAGFCCDPVFAGDADGNFVATWRHDSNDTGASVRKIGPDGVPLMPEFVLTNRPSDDPEYPYRYYSYRVDVDTDAKGNFIVAWADDSDVVEDQQGFTVQSRRFDTKGNPSPAKLLSTDGSDYYLGVEVDPAGRFIVAWPEGTSYPEPIVARRGTGDALAGPVVPIGEAEGSSTPFTTEVTVDGVGNWLISWNTNDTGEILGRITDANLTPLSSVFSLTGDISPFYASEGDVVGLDAGGFIVVWHNYNDYGASARVIDTSGAIVDGFDVASSGYVRDTAAARVNANHFVVAWNEYDYDDEANHVVVQLYENDGTPAGSPFVVDPNASYVGSLNYLAASGRGDDRFVVGWDGYENPEAGCADEEECGLLARTFGVSHGPQEILLPGRGLTITNKIPDDPEANKASWQVSNAAVEGPLPGGLDDPRCLFDPSGTAKASIRFRSETSGHDTGPIGLPCQNWTAFGASPQRSFKYKDKELDDGPCSTLTLKHGKSVNATCRGKNGVVSFDYDLLPGISEGTVDVALTLGERSYCTSYPPFISDGSDGKRFLGKNAPVAAACPDP